MLLIGIDPMKLLRALGVVVGLVVFPLIVFADGWTGFYGGASLGGRVANSDWKTECLLPVLVSCSTGNAAFATRFPTANPSDLNTVDVRVGGHLGFNLQLQSWVVGLESDFSYANNDSQRTGIPGTYLPGSATADTIKVENSFDASLRARGGFLVMPDILLYATGGVSWLHKKVSAECNTPLFPTGWCIQVNKGSASSMPVGWTVGTGLEWMFAQHWIARGEYRYAGYGSTRATFFANVPVDSIRVRTDQSIHAMTIGISYLLN
jgi:outer membrane immunogenic protein